MFELKQLINEVRNNLVQYKVTKHVDYLKNNITQATAYLEKNTEIPPASLALIITLYLDLAATYFKLAYAENNPNHLLFSIKCYEGMMSLSQKSPDLFQQQRQHAYFSILMIQWSHWILRLDTIENKKAQEGQLTDQDKKELEDIDHFFNHLATIISQPDHLAYLKTRFNFNHESFHTHRVLAEELLWAKPIKPGSSQEPPARVRNNSFWSQPINPIEDSKHYYFLLLKWSNVYSEFNKGQPSLHFIEFMTFSFLFIAKKLSEQHQIKPDNPVQDIALQLLLTQMHILLAKDKMPLSQVMPLLIERHRRLLTPFEGPRFLNNLNDRLSFLDQKNPLKKLEFKAMCVEIFQSLRSKLSGEDYKVVKAMLHQLINSECEKLLNPQGPSPHSNTM